MRMSSSDDWTVQTLDAQSGDGIRKDPYVGFLFNFPLSQMGAQSGHYTFTNGPTWDAPALHQYNYNIGLDGWINLRHSTRLAGLVANGSTANDVRFATPYKASSTWYDSGGETAYVGQISYAVSGAPSGDATRGGFFGLSANDSHFFLADNELNFIDQNDFSGTANDIDGQLRYKAFD